jgi:formylglycine-generating enzyme required for sulfatase activity
MQDKEVESAENKQKPVIGELINITTGTEDNSLDIKKSMNESRKTSIDNNVILKESNLENSPENFRNSVFPKNFTSLSTGMKFVLIPAGEFLMGSNESDWEKPIHEVKINKPFYLGIYPVTQRQWELIMNKFRSKLKGLDNPVKNISWYEAVDFIKKFNKMEDTVKYRLPSEAEWEYACRAGTTTRYSFGDDESKLGDYAWYNENADSEIHPVGMKNPNPWGIYDMHGNVLELCQDKWHENYDGAPFDGSAWRNRDVTGASHVMRGGGCNNQSSSCRSSSRGKIPPLGRNSNLGFRVVREI